MIVLRVMLVDDEPLARQRLCRLLGEIPGVQLAGEFVCAQQLLQAERPLACDVLLLDIEMPEIDGFTLLKLLPAPQPYVIFVTAYSQHAVKAFEVAAIDYVLKPVSAERLGQAIARAAAQIQLQQAKQSEAVDSNAGQYVTQISLPMGRRMHLTESSSIDCLVAQGNYVSIHLGAREFVMRRPLAWFEANFDPQLFVRIHRTAIVRLSAIESVEAQPSGRYKLRLKSGITLHSGRTFRESLRVKLAL
jgi:two-component system, LytTR family, response regulator